MMGYKYEEHNLAYHIKVHDDWQEDDSAGVMAAHIMIDTLPIIKIGDKYHDYPGAMRALKAIKRKIRA